MTSITQEIAQLAHHLPHQLLLRLATQLEKIESNDWGYIRAIILSNTPQARHRTLVSQLLTHWQTEAATIPASTIAFALKTATHTAQTNAPTTELIWTGPPNHNQNVSFAQADPNAPVNDSSHHIQTSYL